jgi:hypothetical protein
MPGIEPRLADCPACNLVTILNGSPYWRLIRSSTFFVLVAPSSSVERPQCDAVNEYVELYRRAPNTPPHPDILEFFALI